MIYKSPYAYGTLTLSRHGKYIPAGFNRQNGCYRDGCVAFFIDGGNDTRCLHIDGSTVLRCKVTDKAGNLVQDSLSPVKLDVFPELKCETGYRGIAVALDPSLLPLKKFDCYYFSVAFFDLDGNACLVLNAEFFYGLQYFGVREEDYDLFEELDIVDSFEITKSKVITDAYVNDAHFNLTLELELWNGNTTPEQLVNCVRIFWYCYPKYYARFGREVHAPTKVILRVADEGYGIACCWGNHVHIHDTWLKKCPDDYDCLTHEFAHVAQNGWNGKYCQFGDFIELFADYCRFVYAYRDGIFNDNHWSLHKAEGDTLKHSVRFLAYIDYTYSTAEIDFVKRFFNTCFEEKYPAEQWDKAWEEIFAGTAAEGKSIDAVFAEYQASEFGSLSTRTELPGGVSPLNEKLDVRNVLLLRRFPH